MVKVKNINGTPESKSSCSCGSWMSHWRKFSIYDEPTYCVVKSCIKKVESGTLVQVCSTDDKSLYILPMCHFHSTQQNEELETPFDFLLIPVNQCGNKE